jgi:ATP-dependent DNA helicase RecQ
VLVGADTEAIRQRGHDALSTYGIGADLPRESWQAIGRELIRLGMIATAPGKFATLQLTPSGWTALRQRTPITLTKPAATKPSKPHKKASGQIECNEQLFEHLRKLRRQLADERDVPAYVIFSDVSLREMARTCPTTTSEFERVPGVGKQKLKDFGKIFTTAITEFMGNGSREVAKPPML